MDMLVLGGTRFVGRHLVEAAQASGHRVTLFHRGRSGRPTGCLRPRI
jgi:2'-hydroxyisoflavone reductase